MGKKNNGGNHMGPLERSRYLQGQGDRYGVSRDDYNIERPGGGRYDQFDERGYEQEILRRARVENESALRDGQNSGSKYFDKLKDIKGLNNAGELIKFDDAMEKFGKNELDQKKTSSVNDFANIRDSLYDMRIKKQSDDMRDDFDAKYASAARLNKLQDSIQKRAQQTGPTKISSTLSNARESVEAFDEEMMTRQGANIFGSIAPYNDLELATKEVLDNEASGDGIGRDNDYTNDYKLTVGDGLKLSGIPTRGPGSGIYGRGF